MNETAHVDLGERASTRRAVGSRIRSSRKDDCRRSRLALVDEFPMRRESTCELLRTFLRERALCFANSLELLREMRRDTQQPRGVIISIGAQSVAQPAFLDPLHQLLSLLDSKPVVVLSDREDMEEVVVAFRAGVRGYVPTSMEPPVVIQAIRMVLSGGEFFPVNALTETRLAKTPPRRPLIAAPEIAAPRDPDHIAPPLERGKDILRLRANWPSRQLSVLALILEGKANKEIAHALAMDESTVKSRVRQIMRKLGVTNRTQVALCARKLGILDA